MTSQDADKTWLAKVAKYIMIGDDLYKCGYGQPLLKCVRQSKHSILLRNYTKAFAATIPVHVPWPLEYLEPDTSGRP